MKTILITGVRGGIGSAIVKKFKNSGFVIFGLDYQDTLEGWVDAAGLFGDSGNDDADGENQLYINSYTEFSNGVLPKNITDRGCGSTGLYYVKTDLTSEESVKNAFKTVSRCLKAMDSKECGNKDIRNEKCSNFESRQTNSNPGENKKKINKSGNSGNDETGNNNAILFLDGIIHAAGKYDLNSLVEMPEKDFVGIFEINVFAIYRVNKAFISLLNDGSRIIVTASELAPLDPLPFTGIYGITKTTIDKYCHSLRMELQLLGIKVIELRPGAVQTGLLDVSMNRIDSFVNETKLYEYSSRNFKKIATSVESKSIAPDTLAEFIYKIFNKKNPKFIYNINRNPLLLLLNALPDRFQTWVIKQILIQK